MCFLWPYYTIIFTCSQEVLQHFTNLLHVYLAFNLTIYTIDLIIYFIA
nr:MAG TPA: hypothetical protein [Caudoviricetes sp.]